VARRPAVLGRPVGLRSTTLDNGAYVYRQRKNPASAGFCPIWRRTPYVYRSKVRKPCAAARWRDGASRRQDARRLRLATRSLQRDPYLRGDLAQQQPLEQQAEARGRDAQARVEEAERAVKDALARAAAAAAAQTAADASATRSAEQAQEALARAEQAEKDRAGELERARDVEQERGWALEQARQSAATPWR
jgi:hypothetical protein